MNACEATLAALDRPLQLDRLATSARRGRRTGSRASDVAAKGLLCSAGRAETKNLAAISQGTPRLVATVRVA